nr:hypothetical protein [Streptomyces sp. FT05W]
MIAETVDGRTITFAHDAAGRTTRRITPTGVISEFTYDTAGNRTALHTDGHSLAFTRDPRGRERSAP